jgi:hypothetical protein
MPTYQPIRATNITHIAPRGLGSRVCQRCGVVAKDARQDRDICRDCSGTERLIALFADHGVDVGTIEDADWAQIEAAAGMKPKSRSAKYKAIAESINERRFQVAS